MAEVIINEILCYCRNKFELVTIKQLKLVLCSFYSEEELENAKMLLHEAASKAITNFPRLIKRTKSDNRCKLLVDDIVEYLTKLDEELSWDKMPIYVAQNISRIPTVPIEDIEIFIMSQKLENLELRMRKMEVEKVCSDHLSTKLCPIPVPSASVVSAVVSDVSESVEGASVPGASDGVIGEVLEDNKEEGSWAAVTRKGVKKKNHSTVKVVGCNKTQVSKLKPAKHLQRKFVFHLDNVTDDLSCTDVESFLSDANVTVINCFEAKSWIRFKKDSSETCHAFRVCVKEEDKSKVLDSALWPEDVLIREWKFKNTTNTDNGR